ncbi:glucosamine-6-phosphate deaminase [Robertmurraya siralis]|uniref:glucosamine-6-phosphate deaminase n=1 Tax=Robertmurraya siralis TaxID=77777 RepID=UPI0010F8F7A7|nr:glucosamine-6-phosphate deaminase [Robertmurraya siralis]
MEIICVNNYDEMSERAAAMIADQIKHVPHSTLGLATGSTPEGLYRSLIQKNRQDKVSFKDVTTFNLDEYIGLSETDTNSYHFFMHSHFFDYIDIQHYNIHIPNGLANDLEQECENYEAKIRNIDIQVLGLGLNGHIGFNEPGTSFLSRTHLVHLTESTRKANSRYFKTIEDVPERAITMGINTIMKSKKIILLVSGERKAEAVERLMNGEISEDFPASVLQRHPNVVLIGDKAALKKLRLQNEFIC